MKIHSVTSWLVVSLAAVIVLMGCVPTPPLPPIPSPTPPPAQPPTPSPTPQLPAPTLVSKFKSTSGRTIIEYYTYDSGICGTGGNCNFRGSLPASAGFDQVEVFLSGFILETQSKEDKISHVQAQVHKFLYDKITGDLEVGVSGQLSTSSGQPYAYHITFVVILTDATAAKFTHAGNGCRGQAQCHVTASLAGAVPTGMQYIGLGTRIFDLGSESGPLLINTLSAHIDSLTVTPPNVQLDYLCSLRDAAGANGMYCEWDASIIAFDPAEMAQNNSSIPPQYTFLATGTTTAHRWTEHAQPAAGTAFTGFLDAFEGLTFFYPTGQEHEIWMAEAMASNFQLSGTPPTEALTDYGIFLGTTFGDTANAQTYTYQESRAFGFLR